MVTLYPNFVTTVTTLSPPGGDVQNPFIYYGFRRFVTTSPLFFKFLINYNIQNIHIRFFAVIRGYMYVRK